MEWGAIIGGLLALAIPIIGWLIKRYWGKDEAKKTAVAREKKAVTREKEKMKELRIKKFNRMSAHKRQRAIAQGWDPEK